VQPVPFFQEPFFSLSDQTLKSQRLPGDEFSGNAITLSRDVPCCPTLDWVTPSATRPNGLRRTTPSPRPFAPKYRISCVTERKGGDEKP